MPGWGKEISDAAQIDFSRTALGVRNPANAPDDWERQQMEQMSFMLDAGIDPETLEIAGDRQEGEENVFRWMRPILMAETCLACHGEAIDPRVKLLLGQEYPLDEATGYSARPARRRVFGAQGAERRRQACAALAAPIAVAPVTPLADRAGPDDAPLVDRPLPLTTEPPERRARRLRPSRPSCRRHRPARRWPTPRPAASARARACRADR